MDPKKIEAIENQEPLSSVKGVRSFVGFINFYRDFILGFSKIAAPLTDLTKKENQKQPFQLPPQALAAFKDLKAKAMSDPILAHWDPSRKTVLEPNSSGFAAGGSLSQY